MRGLNLVDVKSLLARMVLAGVLSLAMLALSYPGKATTTRPGQPMSCCQHDGANSPKPGHQPGPFDSQGFPCCPACALALGIAPSEEASLIFSPGKGETLIAGPEAALAKNLRPPVPPPRSFVA